MTPPPAHAMALAEQAFKLGNIKESVLLAKQVLATHPNNERATKLVAAIQSHLREQKNAHNEPPSNILDKAKVLLGNKQYQVVSQYAQQQLRQYPKSCYLREFLSQALAEEGDLTAAESTLVEAIKINNQYWSLFNNLGFILSKQGKVDQSLAAYLQAIQLAPDNENCLINAGASIIQLDDKLLAIKYFEKLINAWPRYAPWYGALGNLLVVRGNFEDASQVLEAGMRIDDQDIDILCNLGIIKQRQGQFEQAINLFKRTIAAGGDIDLNETNIGHAYLQLKDYEKAAIHFSNALQANPEHNNAYFGKAFANSHLCRWSQIDEQLPATIESDLPEYLVSPFQAIALDEDPASHLIRNRYYADIKKADINLRPIPAIKQLPEKIKLGYFSSDYHNHATMHLMIRMFEAHSDRFEVHIFSYDRAPNDPMRERLINSVDKFHDITKLSDEQAAMFARDLGIHIAVDLKGYTANTRSTIMAYRAAPIQIAYLGYPGTMGTTDIDYIVADAVLIPEEHQQHFTEKVIYMPNSYQINDNSRPLPKLTTSRADHGLPENDFVFCCFNNNYKITQKEFSIWMRLLKQTPNSVLWLLSGNPTAEKNLTAYAASHGVDADRLVFAKRTNPQVHLNRQCHADLFLDTFICNAHTTMSDILWAGVPAITKLGYSFAGRVGASLLKAADLSVLITESYEDYESLALALSSDPERLASIRTKLENNRHKVSLFDTDSFTTNMEQAYIKSINNMVTKGEAQHIFL